MDDQPMWAADHVVAPTPGSSVTIFDTANEFSIKGNHLTFIKVNQFDGRTKSDPHKHIHEFLRICDMFKYKDTKNEVVRLMMFPLSLIAFSQHENETLTDAWLHMKEMLRNWHGHNLSKRNIIKIFYHGFNEMTQEALNVAVGGPSNTNTNKIMVRTDVMAMKMDAQYKEMKSRSNYSISEYDEDDQPMSLEEESKFMQTFRPKFDRLADKQSARPSGSLPSNTQPNPKGNSSKPYQPPQARNEHSNKD
ncbi:hypothetical protein Tco_0841574 [Tanacetum coccineum]|uniref:Reverse transcriptase domain-containing protein n=1 Tax=Tanacetum coccineum TaxID=301880 RepID=A0ABQ5AZ18_9ASTR